MREITSLTVVAFLFLCQEHSTDKNQVLSEPLAPRLAEIRVWHFNRFEIKEHFEQQLSKNSRLHS
jgi:hypothetical protein